MKEWANLFVEKNSGIYPHGLFGELVSCARLEKEMVRLCWCQEQPRLAGGVVELTFAYDASPVGSPAGLWTSQEWRLVDM